MLCDYSQLTFDDFMMILSFLLLTSISQFVWSGSISVEDTTVAVTIIRPITIFCGDKQHSINHLLPLIVYQSLVASRCPLTSFRLKFRVWQPVMIDYLSDVLTSLSLRIVNHGLAASLWRRGIYRIIHTVFSFTVVINHHS